MTPEDDTLDERHLGLYMGVVVDRDDPERLGRVRVRIPGLVEPASAWAFPLGTVGGGSEGRGFFAVPELGADVGVLFHQGDVDHPFYLAGHWGRRDGRDEVPVAVRGQPVAAAPRVRAFESARFLLVFHDVEGDEVLELRDKATGDAISIASGAGVALHSSTAVRVDAPEVFIQATSRVAIESDVVKIAGDGPAAARVGDPVASSADFAIWIAQVTAVCNSLVPFSVQPVAGPIAEIGSGSTKVTIG
jgi:uncharacterized protein involved in type VI secretion and phage assembly